VSSTGPRHFSRAASEPCPRASVKPSDITITRSLAGPSAGSFLPDREKRTGAYREATWDPLQTRLRPTSIPRDGAIGSATDRKMVVAPDAERQAFFGSRSRERTNRLRAFCTNARHGRANHRSAGKRLALCRTARRWAAHWEHSGPQVCTAQRHQTNVSSDPQIALVCGGVLNQFDSSPLGRTISQPETRRAANCEREGWFGPQVFLHCGLVNAHLSFQRRVFIHRQREVPG
jgi:hypothetical protein